jgi:AraC-like DNA-binding protein
MTVTSKRVPVRYFALLRDALQADGVDTAQLLRTAGIEAARFEQREGTLLPSEVESFIATAKHLTGRSDLGFEMGRLIKMTSHDLLGLGMLSCRNLDEVLRLVARHYHLMTEVFTFRYRRSPGFGETVYTPAMAMELETLRFWCEALAVAHHTQLQLMLGDRLGTYAIYLSIPEPPHLTRYGAMRPAIIHFDESALPGVRVVMSAEQLDVPLPLADPRGLQQIDERCEALGQRSATRDGEWGSYVTMMLREARGELVTLEDLARQINVSARTVDRHLKKEHLQFRDLAQQVRFERACELLIAPGATVAHVALALGFSDAANFRRAFRRVRGMSPSEYQQRAMPSD